MIFFFLIKYLQVLADGVWQIVFVIFLVYTMMPLQIWMAQLYGIILPTIHIGLCLYEIFDKTIDYAVHNQVSVFFFIYFVLTFITN